jgi:multidrug efflux pump subunit AcrB
VLFGGSYAPLPQALIGGLTVSVLLTVFLVPAGFYLAYRGKEPYIFAL